MQGKTEGTIKNEQSRDTGNIGNTRHRSKTNKTQKSKKISNTDPTKKLGANLDTRAG